MEFIKTLQQSKVPHCHFIEVPFWGRKTYWSRHSNTYKVSALGWDTRPSVLSPISALDSSGWFAKRTPERSGSFLKKTKSLKSLSHMQ